MPIEVIINKEKCTGCRICQLWCSYTYNLSFSPSEAHIQIDDIYGLNPEIKFLDTCNKCGQCARHCLYGALILKEEVV